MDWTRISVIIAVIFAGTAAITGWKMWRLKREVGRFTKQVEGALDQIIAGEGMKREAEEIRETLWGRCAEKFARLDQIFKKKEEAGRVERSQMKEMISDISHQTRTPIANIRLYEEFLQEEPLSEQGRAFLGQLGEQTEKLEFLMQSMVKMSRLETGVIQIKSRTENLHETLVDAVAGIVPAAAKKQIELFIECEEQVNLCHDKKWTAEAIFNVLDNAVKYTDAGGSIHVDVARQEIFTRICISDTGKGIALERQAEIFARFYREPEVHEKSGVGIGLYFTRKILELQDGYIEVRSHIGEGSEFCLYLPND